ncbi:MAG: hypothetical protein ACOZCO_09365 [Bacteroidota bacterium]
MKNFIYLLLFTFISSCTIEQHIHINADGSGRLEYSISGMSTDAMNGLLTDSLGVSDENVTGTEDTLKEEMNKFAETLRSVTGISEVKVDADGKTGKYGVSFNFTSLDVLNKIPKETEPNAPDFFSGFKLEKKKFSYTPVKPVEKTEEVENSMADMFKYKLVFSFEKKIKKCSNKNFTVSPDKHSITFEGNINDLNSDKTKVEVKLK